MLSQHHHKGKNHSIVTPAAQGSETGHQHLAEAQVMVLHYHKGPLLPTASSVLAEGKLEMDTEKLG